MTDYCAVLWEHGLGTAREYTTEESVVGIRVFVAMLDVGPLPIAAITLGLKLELAEVASLWEDHVAEHVLMVDDRIFSKSGLVGRVLDEFGAGSSAAPDVGRNFCPRLIRGSASEVVARGMNLVHEPEAFEHLLDTEGLEKLRNAVAPAEVLTILSGLSDHLVGLHTADRHERRTPIDSAVGVFARTLTDRASVETLEVAPSKFRGGSRLGEVATGRLKPPGPGSHELVRANPDKLGAVAVDPDLTGVLGENLHHVRKLLLRLVSREEIEQAEVRRFQSGLLQIVARELVGEFEALDGRNTRATRRIIGRLDGFPFKRIAGERAVHGENTQLGALTFGPSLLFREVEPDGGVESALVDFRGDLVLQPDHCVVDIWCCHNSRCVKNLRFWNTPSADARGFLFVFHESNPPSAPAVWQFQFILSAMGLRPHAHRMV